MLYTNFEGERAPKKRDFLSQFSKKMFKNAQIDLFFQKFACGAEHLAKHGVFLLLYESSENQFGRPKKKVIKIFENFLKIRPPPSIRPCFEWFYYFDRLVMGDRNKLKTLVTVNALYLYLIILINFRREINVIIFPKFSFATIFILKFEIEEVNELT